MKLANNNKEIIQKNKFILSHLDFLNDLIKYSKDSYFKLDFSNNTVIIAGVLTKAIKDNANYNITFSINEWYSCILEQDLKKYLEVLNKAILEKKKVKLSFRIRTSSNETIWVEKNIKPIINENSELEGFFGYIHDISKEIQLEQEFRNIIEYDDVTELPTKHCIKETIDDYFANFSKGQARGALILIDIDDFKYINDSFGHFDGDILLKEIADSLIDIISDEDIVSRYSGDDFIIFKPYINSIEEVDAISREILNSFSKPKKLNGKNVYVTASLGVAIFPDNGECFYDLLKNADAAMYRAKKNGKNEYEIFDQSISIELNKMYLMHRGLRTAINNDELYVVFQPKVTLENSKVNGFEALVRWNNKELGMVSPAEFIPVAESTRSIIPIGSFVLDEVFKKTRELIDSGYTDFKVAINISEVQLRYEDVAQKLKILIEKYEVDSKYIEIEITESVLMKSFDKSINKLEEIRSLGVSIALDDFGTGYSSLNYLTKLPIDVLKIDRSFVVDLSKNDKSRCIVENIIQLSHQLGIKVVAEGVEELQQIEYLKDINCDLVQGYYYSKPVDFEKIQEFLGKFLNKNK